MGDDEEPNYMTDGQQIAVLVVMALAAFLSVVGSAAIIYIVIQGKRWKKGMYHRMVLGLSVADLIHGIDILVQPYLAPPDPRLLGAVGTTASCSFAGFFLYAIVATCLYNFFLAFYYFQTVRQGEDEDKVAAKYERWMHLAGIVLPFVASILGLSLNAFNPAEFRRLCDIAYFPTNCQNDAMFDCTRGLHTEEFIYTVFAILAVPGLAGIAMTSLVYWKVRATLKRSMSYNFGTSDSGDQASKRLKTVGTQAVLYCVSFVNSFLWSATALIAEAAIPGETRASMGEPGWFALNLIGSFFFPLQGFFNFFIYIRPRYQRWRSKHPGESRQWAFRQVLTSRHSPSTRFRTSSNNGSSPRNNLGTVSGQKLPRHGAATDELVEEISVQHGVASADTDDGVVGKE